ncbi:MAG: acylneuraminate cytidylyltransferase family protein [Elusimicrobia bacterium]|nr:acylneuraminate cytidylyltransferase family protein [Elusimicrobiota bacterium]
MSAPRLLAVVPARGGSRGLPGKNVRPLMGLPLIAHSLRLARMCPEVTRCVVSTDSEEIAAVARAHGGEVPFLRPPELARSDTPMWPVLRHAPAEVERAEGRPYDLLMLLDPTSPTRLPEDVRAAVARLAASDADGIVSVSKPEFNPLWHTVVEKDGLMADWLPDAARITRRQDAPTVYRINGLLYVWRADFVRRAESWRTAGRHLMLEVPDERAVSIDDEAQFRRTEALARGGILPMPWLEEKNR